MTFDQILRATTWERVSGRRLASELLSAHLGRYRSLLQRVNHDLAVRGSD